MADFSVQLMAAVREVVPEATHAAVIWPVGTMEAHWHNGWDFLNYDHMPPVSRHMYVDEQGLAAQNVVVVTPQRVEFFRYEGRIKARIFGQRMVPTVKEHLVGWPRGVLRVQTGPAAKGTRPIRIESPDGAVFEQIIGTGDADSATIAAMR